MKKLITLSVLAALVPCAMAQATPVNFRTVAATTIDGKKLPAGTAIEQVQLEHADGVSTAAIKSINNELNKATKEFAKSARECHAAAQRRPWSYHSKLEKVTLSESYIGVVFARDTLCAGTPDFARDPIVFSRKDGKVIPAPELFSKTFPDVALGKSIASDKRLIRIKPDTVEGLLEAEDPDFSEKCEHFLTNTSYKIWMEGTRMIFFPEFSQTNSPCQKEYALKVEQ